MRRLFTLLLLASSVGATPCEGLKAWYDGYNEQYFSNLLPSDTVVSYGNAGGNIAITFKDSARFHIVLEQRYNLAPNQAHESLLHEECHIETWSAHDSLDGHGVAWRGCMDRLYKAGAFDGLL